jgi:queuine/archaeosine tRNA-ribosyltransferase
MIAAMLNSAINLAYYQEPMDDMRSAIAAGRLANFRRERARSGLAATFRPSRDRAFDPEPERAQII